MSRRWNLLNTTFLIGTLAAALVFVPWHLAVHGFRAVEWVTMLVMFYVVGISVTAGYHRLYAHRAYKAAWPVRLALLIAGAAAFENSALKWSSDHRVHHQHVDDLEKDPYAIGKGFWHAHWTWVMEAQDTPIAGVADLEKDPLVRWQHRHHFLIGGLFASIPVLIGLALHDVVGMLVVAVLLRIVLTHHTTFFINSAAHVFGSRPYTDANSARDNWLLAPLTYGEGYHNYHHMWQWDYRNGVKWYAFDSTKWLISALNWMGLARDLRRVPDAVIQRAKLAMEQKRLREKLELNAPAVAVPMKQRLEQAHARLDQALASFQERRAAWQAKKAEWKAKGQAKAEAFRTAQAEWKAALELHREELRQAWREWKAARLEARASLAYA